MPCLKVVILKDFLFGIPKYKVLVKVRSQIIYFEIDFFLDSE